MVIIENLNKSFENKILFKDFNLKIEKGSFVVISGKSGSGKTTLLNMIGGIETIDSGNVIVDGIEVHKGKNKRKYYQETVGFLFQNFGLLENKTVKQNLDLIKKDNRNDVTVSDVLMRVGLSGMEEKKVYTLSGGEQQRVALARLMLKKCSIILADEPTGSLDEGNSKRVMDILHELNEMGKTVLLVTHNKDIIESEGNVINIG